MRLDVFKENMDTTVILLMMTTEMTERMEKKTLHLTRPHLTRNVTMTSIGNTMVRFITLKKNGEKLKEKQVKKLQKRQERKNNGKLSITQKALLNL